MYRKAELKELVDIHGHFGKLVSDEVEIVKAVLDLREKTVGMILTPLEYAVMLPLSATLDSPTMKFLLKAGHSRIPVYKTNSHNIIGVVIVKQLIAAGSDSGVDAKLIDIPIRTVPKVDIGMPLFRILHLFQRGGSHLAIVVDNKRDEKNRVVGIVTLEDVIEEMIGAEILDETDVYVDVAARTR